MDVDFVQREPQEATMNEHSTPTEKETLHVVLEVADHESLTDLLALVHRSSLPVRTESITKAGLSGDDTIEIEIDILTAKQRQTLELALKRGYYDRPREADLTDLAEELDISKSAVSQRLRTAERKLVKGVLG